MKDISGKDHLHKLRQLLEVETVEDHELVMEEMIEKLKLELGDDIRVDKKTFMDDMMRNIFYKV